MNSRLNNLYPAAMTDLHTSTFDLFWRNPYNYWKQLQESAEVDVAWDRGVLRKNNIDQQKFSKLTFDKVGKFWRSYSISSWDCIEYDSDCKIGVPRAVYPAFDWDDNLEILLDFIVNPWGKNEEKCGDKTVPLNERPVMGQPHRVFITNLPNNLTTTGRLALSLLSRLQMLNPDVELYIHRLYGYGNLFGNGFRAGDLDPRMRASKGQIQLTGGKYFDPRTVDQKDLAALIRPLGWVPEDLADAGNRCLFNIQSARYASLHWDDDTRPPEMIPSSFKPDIHSPDASAQLVTVKKKIDVRPPMALTTK